MPYYCTECEKYHADMYKKHWQYKKIKKPILEVPGEEPVEIGFEEACKMIEANAHNLADLTTENSIKIGKLEKERDVDKNEIWHLKGKVGYLEEKITELEKSIWLITGILKSWKMYMDRKHPYKYMYEEEFEDL